MKRKLNNRIDFLLTRAKGYSICGNRDKAFEMVRDAFEMIHQLVLWGLISIDEADKYEDVIAHTYADI